MYSVAPRIEKLAQMRMNPLKRGLVTDPKLWPWSSYSFRQFREVGLRDPDPETLRRGRKPRPNTHPLLKSKECAPGDEEGRYRRELVLGYM